MKIYEITEKLTDSTLLEDITEILQLTVSIMGATKNKEEMLEHDYNYVAVILERVKTALKKADAIINI